MTTLSDHNTESSRIKEYNTKNNLYNSRDPDRYYLEEYFKRLPSTNGNISASTNIIFSSSVTITDDITSNTGTLTQPANTILIDVGVVVTGTFTTGVAATDLDVGTNALGVEIVSGGSGLGSGGATSATIATDVIASVGNTGLPDSSAITLSFVNSAPLFTTLSRTIYFTVDKNAAAVTSAGTVQFFIKFASTDTTTITTKNSDFELQGTNHTTGAITFNTSIAGINNLTGSKINDQMIIVPHQDTNQTAWNGITWNTNDEVIWECAIRTGGSISNTAFWAGLKGTSVGGYATDNHQAYFLYSSDDTMGALTTNANLHFVYSVSGTDYITNLGIVVAIDTVYKLKIVIDSDRKVSIYVNGKVYGLVITETSGGSTQSNIGQKSVALSTGNPLNPYIGVETLSASTSSINIFYQKISRSLL